MLRRDFPIPYLQGTIGMRRPHGRKYEGDFQLKFSLQAALVIKPSQVLTEQELIIAAKLLKALNNANFSLLCNFDLA